MPETTQQAGGDWFPLMCLLLMKKLEIIIMTMVISKVPCQGHAEHITDLFRPHSLPLGWMHDWPHFTARKLRCRERRGWSELTPIAAPPSPLSTFPTGRFCITGDYFIHIRPSC